MKVLSVIDSLIAAGAERMAVNIANALADEGVESHLCATHFGGPLEEFIGEKVHAIILRKKGVWDIQSFLKLRKYILRNNIRIIHAHSSSVFWCVLVKIFTPGLKVVWHDHFGFSEQLHKRPWIVLRLLAPFLNHAFVVNGKLLNFAVSKLKIDASKVSFLPNFANLNFDKLANTNADIPDAEYYPKIVCLANLRPQKDHHNLLNAFEIVLSQFPQARLYLVGGHFNDDYYHSIINHISQNNELTGKVHVLGSRNDVEAILSACNIGVLSSVSEGLPVSLLEYGLAQLPVVCTNVGDCAFVLNNGDCGKLVEPQNHIALAQSILYYLNNIQKAKKDSSLLNSRIINDFSTKGAITNIINVYNKMI